MSIDTSMQAWHPGGSRDCRADATLANCSTSGIEAEVEEAVETAGSLLDLIEAADIVDEACSPTLSPCTCLSCFPHR